jgi:ribosomal protein S18 acetylase RimI-like enzyme
VDNTPGTPEDCNAESLAERVVVRRIRSDDWPGQRALRLEMLADTPIAFLEHLKTARARPDEYWVARNSEHAASTTSAQWVLDTGDRLVGTMACFEDDEGRVHVVSVYLSPAYRGRGFLDRLLAEVVNWADKRGVTMLVLSVAKENRSAVAAYRRRGFVPTGHTYPHPLYGDVTEVEMHCPVDEIRTVDNRGEGPPG